MYIINNWNAYADSREYGVKCSFNNVDITNDDIISLTYEGRMVSEDNISIGDCCSSQVDMEIVVPTGLVLTNASFDLYIGLKINGTMTYAPMGHFIISSVSQKDNITVNITAHDRMAYLSKKFVSNGVQTLEGVIDSICENNDLDLDSSVVLPSIPITTYPDNATDRDMLGYMASLMGKNAFINRSGKLDFKWLTNANQELTDDKIYDINKLSQATYIVYALSCETDSEVLTSGDGRILSFYNPYMTQEILDSIRQSILPISYNANEVEYRGDVCLDLGDIVTYSGSNIPIMVHKIEIDDMLTGFISSYGVSTNEMSLADESAERREIARTFSLLEKAFKETTDRISGVGGYVRDVYENGVKTAIQIVSNDNPNHLWQWSYGGFAYSDDGGTNFRSIAIDLNGNIVANAITAGTMSADRIALHNTSLGGQDSQLSTYFHVETINGQVCLVLGNDSTQIRLVETAQGIEFENYDEDTQQWIWLAKFTPTGLSFRNASFSGLNLGNWDMGVNDDNFNIFYGG